MKVEHLIRIAEARILYLENAKNAAEMIGDVEALIRLTAEMSEVQITLTKLKSIKED